MRYQDPYATNVDDYSRFGGATSRLPQFDSFTSRHTPYSGNQGFSGNAGYTQAPEPAPPRYSTVVGARPEIAHTWYDPRGWSLRKKLIVAGCVIVVIVGVVVGAVEGVKLNAYPDYSQLNYTLVDTYSGSDFFDNFAYYTSTDPTDGFVQ